MDVYKTFYKLLTNTILILMLAFVKLAKTFDLKIYCEIIARVFVNTTPRSFHELSKTSQIVSDNL